MYEINKEISLLRREIAQIETEKTKINPAHKNYKLLTKINKANLNKLKELKKIRLITIKAEKKIIFEKNAPKLISKMTDYMTLHNI